MLENIWATFETKICQQDPSKIAQSGHIVTMDKHVF